MKMDNDVIQKVTSGVVSKTIEALGDRVNRIVLYGSYARGDFSPESDVDVMILLNCTHDELKDYRTLVSKIASELSLDNDIEVSLMLEDVETYERWIDVLVFYQNIRKEGVVLYE